MTDSTETFDALWEYCTSDRRVVPGPMYWNELFEMLADRRRTATGGWEPPPPLILGAWHDSPPMFKVLRLREHLEWARDHGQLDQVGSYLRSLSEEAWYHIGE